IKTDAPCIVLYGEDEESVGRLSGISDGKLLVGEGAAAQTVDLSAVTAVLPTAAGEVSFLNRTRAYWRYWHGQFGLSLNYGQATVDTLGFLLDFEADRKKKPTRLLFKLGYRYGTQKEKDMDRTRTQDQLFGGLRGEYDLTSAFYVFGSGDLEYNGIQN